MALLSSLPDLFDQLHPILNKNITLTQLTTGSKHKVWWQCDKGHEWEAVVSDRAGKTKTGCPYCSGKKVFSGFNDLATTHPELALEWHPEKNIINVTEVSRGHRGNVWWYKKECGHEWESNVLNRVSGNGCYQCLGRKKSSPQGFLKEDATLFAELHPNKNIHVDETLLKKFSSVSVWWLGQCGHEWKSSPAVRSSSKGCPYCSSNQVLVGFNDLVTKFPYIAAEWHPTKNSNLMLEKIAPGSKKKVWWLGSKCGHEWKSSISGRTGRDKTNCPYCSNRATLSGFNDLATTHPELLEEWDYNKNITTLPTDVVAGSGIKVWWQCNKGHEWESKITNRALVKSGCPGCAARTYVSKAETEVGNYVKTLLPTINIETSVRSLNKIVELDIYIPEKNIAIEFNGLYWHSEKFRTRTYHYDKWLECKEQGIQLIQIWEDDWNNNSELIKRMIAHKLNVSNEPVVYARKTTIKKVSTIEAKQFLTENHLQGYRTAKYYGSYYQGKIVNILGVAKKGDDGLEIIRYAVNCKVTGGFSRLLKFILKLKEFEHIKKIYSYSHNDHSDGNVYSKNNFMLEHSGSPGYFYFKSGWKKREFRLKYSPSRVKKNPNLQYIEGASERELADLNNMYRIWDSGSSLWVKQIS